MLGYKLKTYNYSTLAYKVGLYVIVHVLDIYSFNHNYWKIYFI